MTPEEHFARLRDTRNWTVTAPVAPRRIRRFAVIAAPIAIAAVLAVVFVLAATSLRGMRPVPPASPSPTTSALPTDQSWTTPPQRLFNGECSQVFSDDELSRVLGYDIALGGSTWAVDARPRTAVVAHNGGLSCFWKTADATHPGLAVSIVPEALVPLRKDADYCSAASQNLCHITIVESGIVLAGAFDVGHGRTLEEPSATLRALREAFADKIAGLHRIPAIYSANEGDWTNGTDCFALARHIGFGSDFSGGPLLPGALSADDYSGDAVPFVGSTVCDFFSTSGGDLAVETLSGGAWLDPLVDAAHGNPIDVPGADSGYMVIRGSGNAAQRILYAFAGTNLLALTTPATGGVTEDRLIAYARNEISGLNSDNSIATSAPPASSTPTGTPTSSNAAALGELLLSSEGLGDVRIGQPVPASSTVMSWDTGFCPAYDGQPASPVHEWVPALRAADDPFPYFVWNRGRIFDRSTSVEAIFVRSPYIHTKHGLHIGSSRADVIALGGRSYPSSSYPEALVIQGDAGQLLFSIDDDRVVLISVTEKGAQDPSGFGLCD